MTWCTTCVTVVAMLLQLLSHVLPNTDMGDTSLGWWRLGSGQENKDSWIVPLIHTIALLADLLALVAWCNYSVEEFRDNRSAEGYKGISKLAGGVSAFMKGCGCGWHLCYPKPGMVGCCVASIASLLFTLISTVSSATEEYEPREKHRKDPSYLA